MTSTVTTDSGGLRERKKQLTRKAIVTAAERLFEERGYDNVTVAEIADAANVSVKTLFVYFRSKEDLAFADTSLLDGIVAAIASRAPGSSPSQVVADYLIRAYNDPANISTLEGFHRGFGSSQAVQNRLLRMWAELENRLIDVLLAHDVAARPAGTWLARQAATRAYAAGLVAVVRSVTSSELRVAVEGKSARRASAIAAEWLRAAAAQLGEAPA